MAKRLILISFLGAGALACGDETPPEADGDADADGDGDGDTDADTDADADGDPPEYFPLTAGTSWDYDEVSPGGNQRTLHKEITGCETVTFDDCETGSPVSFDVAVWSSTGSANPEENGVAYLTSTDAGVMRVIQEMYDLGSLAFTQRYSPGFLRFPNAPYDIGREIDVTHQRCETDESTGVVTETPKRYHWSIEAAEAVDVPAGHFDDCLRIRRTNLDSDETKVFWFCDGVGKVQEHGVDGAGNVSSTEVLTAYTIGETVCPR